MPRAITNLANFPAPLLRALSTDNYTGGGAAGGDISVTRIIAPPRIVTLRKFHEHEIVEDAADRIWLVMGQAGHKVLELSAGEGMTVETRLGMPIEGIDTDDGPLIWKLTGQDDLYDKLNFSIYDYKFTSVWSLMFGEKPEWERQVNLQAMLHRHHKDRVDHGYIVALLRDYSKRKASYEKDYPNAQAKVIEIPMWTQDEAYDYAQRRVRIHQKAQIAYIKEGKSADALPLCTPEERWYRGGGWAVKKMDSKGKINKKADRVYTEKTDAIQHMTDNSASLPKGKSWAPLEERKGENIRCMSYCDVWQWCPFGKALHDEVAQLPADPELALDTED